MRPALRPVLPALTALALGAAGVVPLALSAPAQAAVSGDQLVISEVYAGGGSSTSTIARDYVELYNPTAAPVPVDGFSVQYRAAANEGDPSGVAPLAGSVPARGHYLVGLSPSGSGAGAAELPTPDATGSFALSATGGTVLLARQSGALTSLPSASVTGDPRVADVVGWGTGKTYEKAPAPTATTSTSIARTSPGTDTDDNSADLAAGPTTPRSAPAGPGTPEPPAPATDATIAEVQGTGPTSPLAGRRVRTTGVVTAAYPTGGLNGFFLQTAGTGGPAGDRTASDAVFVYGSAATRTVAVGDHVQVTGAVAEYQGTTQLTPASAADVVDLPGAAGVTPTATGWPRTEAERERLEGMLLAPRGPFTVSDNFALNQYAEIGLAAGTTPLVQPTEVADPDDADAIRAVTQDNAARAVTLDDGATTNFLTAKDTPLPYLTQDREIRVGAPVSFDQPVVLDHRFSTWRFQPTDQLTAAGPLPVTFTDTRTSAPEPVGGRMRVASFNVLNYFTTTGEDFEAAGGRCTYYTDRGGARDTVNRCSGPSGDGPRGAAEEDDLARQQDKLVAALNALRADVVSLEELENSAKFGLDRDAALADLTAALNASAGAGTWDFVRSPRSANSPAAQADEDVIRTGFVYRPDAVRPVGESVIDDVPAFAQARDPLAQSFEPRRSGGPQSRFVVVVNHFKSKGSGAPGDGDTGQGASNLARVAQAEELVRFADRMSRTVATGRVFLAGDFNAYTREDPLQVLYDAGYTDIGSALAPGEFTYLFGGRVGSLDHVLGNAAAMRTVTGAHVWQLNAVEPVALEYSRYNYNATDFYRPDPYRSSDHDPLVVGLDPRPGRGAGR